MPSAIDFGNGLSLPNELGNSAEMQNYTQLYVYDLLGNLLQMQSQGRWTRNYFYNSADNKLLGHTQNTTEYTYDAHGNMLTMPHLSNMVWDFNNRLFNTGNGTFSEFYNYDATGNRARKTTEKTNVLEERYYIGNYEVYRKFENGNLILERSTIHLMADTQRIATIDKETGGATLVRYQYNDHLGSACLKYLLLTRNTRNCILKYTVHFYCS